MAIMHKRELTFALSYGILEKTGEQTEGWER